VDMDFFFAVEELFTSFALMDQVMSVQMASVVTYCSAVVRKVGIPILTSLEILSDDL